MQCPKYVATEKSAIKCSGILSFMSGTHTNQSVNPASRDVFNSVDIFPPYFMTKFNITLASALRVLD
jgi:hypothetical protein